MTLSTGVAVKQHQCLLPLHKSTKILALYTLRNPLDHVKIAERKHTQSLWRTSPLLRHSLSFTTPTRSPSNALDQPVSPTTSKRRPLSAELPRLRMAFSMANVTAGLGSSASAGAGGVHVQDGPELQEIQTDQLGFKGVNGEAKLRLLEKPWSSDNLPLPSASLLGIASSQGLLAAAGPDALIVCTTEGVRESLRDNSDNSIKSIKPIVTINHTRLAHVTFSADESVLVVSEQNGGGIVAYQVSQLKNEQVVPALHIETNNVGLRALIPNPAVSSAQFFAAVTLNGELLLADLANNKLVQGSNGLVLATNVSCLAWSNKGKAIVAGLGDGTAIQIKPDGTIMAHIPKSASIPGDVHISNICWLENDSFLIIYTPNDTGTENGIPPSEYYLVTRDKTNYTFQRIPEILPPFGVERLPTHHLITRLRSWKPHIYDLLILAATTATDIGIISKSNKALSNTDVVTNTFTFTSIDDDRRRAALPLSVEGSLDTTPIGMALDLSATEKVPGPILGDDELLESDGPLPNLMVLNNEGILCSWWVIYNDSLYEKTTFSGFANLSTMHEARSAVPEALADTSAPSQPSMSSSEVVSSTSSPFVQPSSTFGSSTFGSSTQAGFGSGTGFSTKPSITENKGSWTSTGFGSGASLSTNGAASTTSVFGQSGFGPSTTPAFGSTGALGARPGGFGQAPAAAPSFGQPTFGTKPAASGAFGTASAASPFASTGSKPGASGFSAFSSNAGFGGFGGAKKPDGNASGFAQTSGGSIFSQASSGGSTFAKPANASSFGQSSNAGPFASSGLFNPAKPDPSKPIFGTKGSFKLDSTFKSDGSAKDDLPKPANPGFGFGSGFGDMLADSKPVLSPTRDTEAEMDEKDDRGSISNDEETIPRGGTFFGPPTTVKDVPQTLVTPPSTISQTKATPTAPVSNLFGAGPQPSTTPQTFNSGNQWSFDKVNSTTPKDTPAASKTMFGTKPISESTPAAVQKSESINIFQVSEQTQTPSPKIKTEEDENPTITTESPSDNETVNIKKHPEPSLPPVSTSKPGYQTGNTSASSDNSSKVDDAPLPPDFVPANRSAMPEPAEAELPEEDSDDGFSSEFDASGEDVTQDMSPLEEQEDEQDEGEGDDDNDATTYPAPVSPDASFKEDSHSTTTTSPSDGLFTKVSMNQQSKPGRPLFGEVGTSGPIFPPPKPQESPRSPSPIRQFHPHDLLRPDVLRPDSRSVSAPARPRSAIDQRKVEYSQSSIAAQAAKTQEAMIADERARLDAMRQLQEQEKVKQMELLEDHEDLRIQRELAEPLVPSETLDAFITYQAGLETQGSKADIPAQIERLYQDINSMIYTLGINARTLSSFLMYQQSQEPSTTWPDVLQSDTPLDSMNDEWFLEDIQRLHEGCTTIETEIESMSVEPVQQKLERCHSLLSQDLLDLRSKTMTMRKSLHARTHGNSATAPLSAEQASIQHDLRKASATVQTKLVKVEDELTILRTRLLEVAPVTTSNRGQGSTGGSPQKKPTVEAVTNTIAKMTSMAEKKSADVDVLESQLKRLGFGSDSSHVADELEQPSTPHRTRKAGKPVTPGSATSSIYHTPTSNPRSSTRNTPSTNGSSRKASSKIMVSTEDRERWQAKNHKKKNVALVLRMVLEEKRSKATTASV